MEKVQQDEVYEVSSLDKYEYKLRLEEIKALNKKGRFQEAAQVADTIDWKKVRNISTLGIISDVYKINRRFDDAKEILLLANEKSPQNRRIIYSLCDLVIKMGQVVEAIEYYKEYVQLAPNDNSKYILLYKIYEAQDISLEERIAILEEYKKREYNEKWAYELAYLYHRVGLATECVEECDQLILWFGDGKYVVKAMELKMLYTQLSPAQQQAYDRRFGRQGGLAEKPVEAAEVEVQKEPPKEEKPEAEELDIQVKPMDMGQYNTMNLQAALAESMKEVFEPETEQSVQEIHERVEAAAMQRAAYGGDDIEYQEDVSKVVEASGGWNVQETGQLETEEEPEEAAGEVQPPVRETVQAIPRQTVYEAQEPDHKVIAFADPKQETASAAAKREIPAGKTVTDAGVHSADPGRQVSQRVQRAGQDQVRVPGKMENFLAQDYDGQISLALPEEKLVEKQITGQMNIEDVLAEWERRKKDNQEKRKQETREWLLQQTGSLFTDFDKKTQDGVLEKLQREQALPMEQVRKDYREDPSAATEVEELEEIEEPVEDIGHAAPQPVQPMPANAAARAVMAAQGVLDQVPVQEPVREQTMEDQLRAAQEQMLAAQKQMQEVQERLQAAQRQQGVLEKESGQLTGQEAAGQPAAHQEEQTAVSKETAVPENAANEQKIPEEVQADNGLAENAAEQENITEAPAKENGRISAQQPVSSESASVQETAAESTAKEEGTQAEEKPREDSGEEQSEEQKGSVSEDTAAFNMRISEQQLEEHERNMTREEKELFAPFVPTKGAMRQLVKALDMISLSAYTGNMIITGVSATDMMKLAKNIIREVRASDENFSGKIAKISGDVLNTKSADAVIAKIPNGALILEKAGKLSDEGAGNLASALNKEHTGIVVFLLDNKRAVGRLLERCPELASSFTARFDIEALDNNTLVKYGCQYAGNMEYSIDELGRLALHTRIEDLQTSSHAVTVEEVREIVDEAIRHANRKTPRHFLDVLFGKRYDEEDMIVLRERDFI